jgi:ornithine carbamoyltransferase
VTRPRHFLRLLDFSAEELAHLLGRAAELKALRARGEPCRSLAGKTLAMVFDKASTRTRVSFEVGMFELGGQAVFLDAQSSQVGRGEPARDTARVLSRYAHGLLVRTFAHATLEEMAAYAGVPVINGLTDTHHPCQVLAELFTVLERRGRLEGLRYAWLGDGNNVANSWVEAAARFGLDLRVACPEGFEPDRTVLAEAAALRRGHVTLVREPREAAAGADVLVTDVWASMGQEAEAEARRRAFAGFTLDAALLAAADPAALVLHCLPAHRGEEIADDVLEGPRSAVFDEAENRLHVQKALLERLLG